MTIDTYPQPVKTVLNEYNAALKAFQNAVHNQITQLSQTVMHLNTLPQSNTTERNTVNRSITDQGTLLQTRIQMVEASTKSLQDKLERLQCKNGSQHKSVTDYEKRIENQKNEIIKKRDNMLSAEHLGTQVQQLYFRQRKIMWIYVILLIVLLGGIGYLFYASVKSWRSAGQDSGLPDESVKNIDTAALGDDIRNGVESMRNSVVSMFTPKGASAETNAYEEEDMLESSSREAAEAEEEDD